MELTPFQSDVLLELINIGVGRAAGMLNRMINAHVQLRAPELRALSIEEFFSKPCESGCPAFASVRIPFSGYFSGISSLILSKADASKLASLVLAPQGLGEDDAHLRAETLCEIGNIVLTGVMGSVANVMKVKLNCASPVFSEDAIDGILGDRKELSGMILLARTLFTIKDHRISGEALIFFSLESFDVLLAAIDAIAQA